MTNKLLAESSIYRTEGQKTVQAHVPEAVDAALGQPDRVVWLQREDGTVVVVPPSEVDLK